VYITESPNANVLSRNMVVLKMPKILIINTNISWNKGSAAQVASVTRVMRTFLPGIKFTLLSHCPELDQKYCLLYDIDIIGYTLKRFYMFRKRLLFHIIRSLFTTLYCGIIYLLQTLKFARAQHLVEKEKFARIYGEADLVLDLSGDSFSDWKTYGITNVLDILPAIFLKKPLIFFSQTIGPFGYLTLPISKFCLKKSNLIVVREEITKKYLERVIGHDERIFVAADCAFLLEPVNSERVLKILQQKCILEREQPLVGVNVSAFLMEQNKEYLKIIARLIDYIIESKNACVILIPHVIAPSEWLCDDRYAARKIFKLLKNKQKVVLINDDYDSSELKGIIGQCDFFIGSRMHANIAALSQSIPTLAIGWSHKYSGIMKRLGMEKYACDFNNITFEELKTKVDEIFSLKREIRDQLTLKLRDEKSSSFRAIKLVCNLVFNTNEKACGTMRKNEVDSRSS
jgi:polysaccharide pyruvyl transferase WcaK-like protein